MGLTEGSFFASSLPLDEIGIVVIGRNEGERLRRCLDSLTPQCRAVVYVDSCSTDDSVALARARGAEVVELDLSVPFTAARARNAGFDRLLEKWPDPTFAQFLDGDCELAPDWLARAVREFQAQPEVAAVCGRRRERHPEASIYNRLCDIEWDTPIGETRACGGDAMFRVAAFRTAGGYDPSVIAGEEPELCLRLRRAGGKILRIDAEMTVHDAAMTRLSQWARRSIRCGYAYALGAAMHGGEPERHYARECWRVFLWGFLLPTLAVLAAWPTGGWSLLLLLLYPVQAARIYLGARRRGLARRHAVCWGVSCVAAKLPEFVGVCKFAVGRLRRTPARIIEYK